MKNPFNEEYDNVIVTEFEHSFSGNIKAGISDIVQDSHRNGFYIGSAYQLAKSLDVIKQQNEIIKDLINKYVVKK